MALNSATHLSCIWDSYYTLRLIRFIMYSTCRDHVTKIALLSVTAIE
jgi:hypothetical protein